MQCGAVHRVGRAGLVPAAGTSDGAHIWQRHAQFCALLEDAPVLRAMLAAEVERFKPKLLTGSALDTARRREQLLLLPACFA